MKWEVLLTKTAEKGFKSLPKNLQSKCRLVLGKLAINPDLGKRLSGQLSEYCSIRLTTYRIIYRKEGTKLIILVVSIRHRKEVYRKIIP